MPHGHENAFLRVLHQAIERNWCMKPYCTTCGATEYRSALREVGGELGAPLVNALANVNLRELMALPGWEGAVRIAMSDSSFGASVLESWHARTDIDARLADFVIYRFVRHLPDGHPVRTKWISKALSIATRTGDSSLVESLILTLRRQAHQYGDLIETAKRMAQNSAQMRRVLKNACNMQVT